MSLPEGGVCFIVCILSIWHCVFCIIVLVRLSICHLSIIYLSSSVYFLTWHLSNTNSPFTSFVDPVLYHPMEPRFST